MTYHAICLDRATEVFGSTERASDWLEKMSAELGAPPQDLLDSKVGYERVLRHIHAVDLAINTH